MSPFNQIDADLWLMQRVADNDPGAVADLYDRFGSLFTDSPIRPCAPTPRRRSEIFVCLWKPPTATT